MDTAQFGWVWDVDEFWWPEGTWVKVCLSCSSGPIDESKDLCDDCEVP